MRRSPRIARYVVPAALVVAAAVLATLLAPTANAVMCLGDGACATGRPEVSGIVALSPALPVCRVDSPCSRPIPDFQLVFTQEGREAGRAVTDENGIYRIALRPGRYAVSVPGVHHLGAGLNPREVVVARRYPTRVDFTFDSGIR